MCVDVVLCLYVDVVLCMHVSAVMCARACVPVEEVGQAHGLHGAMDEEVGEGVVEGGLVAQRLHQLQQVGLQLFVARLVQLLHA